MAVSGGDPRVLEHGASALGDIDGDLALDATHAAALGKKAGGAAAGHVGELADTALAALGGALTAASVLVAAMAEAARTAGTQLDKATGGGPR